MENDIETQQPPSASKGVLPIAGTAIAFFMLVSAGLIGAGGIAMSMMM